VFFLWPYVTLALFRNTLGLKGTPQVVKVGYSRIMTCLEFPPLRIQQCNNTNSRASQYIAKEGYQASTRGDISAMFHYMRCNVPVSSLSISTLSSSLTTPGGYYNHRSSRSHRRILQRSLQRRSHILGLATPPSKHRRLLEQNHLCRLAVHSLDLRALRKGSIDHAPIVGLPSRASFSPSSVSRAANLFHSLGTYTLNQAPIPHQHPEETANSTFTAAR